MKRSNPLLFTSLCCVTLLCGGLVVWTAFSGWDSDAGEHRGKNNEDSRANVLHSQDRTEFKRQHLSQEPAKKRIDVKARLAALYAKYPDLKPDYPESDKDYSGLFDILFPDSERSEIGKDVGALEKGLLSEDELEEQVVVRFFEKHSWRVDKLVQHLSVDHHYKELEMSQKFLLYQFLTASVGAHLRLGNQEEVFEVNSAIEKVRLGSGEVDLLGYVLSNYAHRKVGEYAIRFAKYDPQFSLDFVSHQRDLKFINALRGDFETVLVSYVWPEVNNLGMFSVSDELDIKIGDFERVLADVSLRRLEYYNELFFEGGYRSPEEVEEEFSLFAPSAEYSESEILAYEEMNFGAGQTHGYYVWGSILKDVHIFVIETAMGRSSPVPKNPRSGEDMILDVERNVLITGLEGDDAEIKIPLLEDE